MCLAIPARIVEIVDAQARIAKVEVSGVRRSISLSLLEEGEASVGDYVLVHVGFAMTKIDERAAEETLRLLDSLEDFEQ